MFAILSLVLNLTLASKHDEENPKVLNGKDTKKPATGPNFSKCKKIKCCSVERTNDEGKMNMPHDLVSYDSLSAILPPFFSHLYLMHIEEVRQLMESFARHSSSSLLSIESRALIDKDRSNFHRCEFAMNVAKLTKDTKEKLEMLGKENLEQQIVILYRYLRDLLILENKFLGPKTWDFSVVKSNIKTLHSFLSYLKKKSKKTDLLEMIKEFLTNREEWSIMSIQHIALLLWLESRKSYIEEFLRGMKNGRNIDILKTLDFCITEFVQDFCTNSK